MTPPVLSMLLAMAAPFLVAAASSADNASEESDHGYSDCSSKMTTLERALYDTPGNVFQFNIIYYPPSMRTTRFIRVVYTFLNETGGDDGCSVTYIWAIGGFLFFQPPAVFTFNSLFFNYPNNNLTNLYLRLPSECRPLIQPPAGAAGDDLRGKCSCVGDSQLLEVLTQQLNIYAKYSAADMVARENSFARAICSEELEREYYSNNNPSFVFVIMCSAIIIPLLTFLLLLASVRNINDNTIQYLTSPANHEMVVSMVLAGTVISIEILVADIMACFVVILDDHEYSSDVQAKSINLYIVFATIFLDTVFFMPLLCSTVYITVCFNGRRIMERICCRVTCSANQCLGALLKLILGKRTFKKLSQRNTISLLFPLMLTTPVLCFSTHLSYILMAWLTEPSKCTTILLFYYVILLYLYAAFKHCYRRSAKARLACLDGPGMGEDGHAIRKCDIEGEGGEEAQVDNNNFATSTDRRGHSSSGKGSGGGSGDSEGSVVKKRYQPPSSVHAHAQDRELVYNNWNTQLGIRFEPTGPISPSLPPPSSSSSSSSSTSSHDTELVKQQQQQQQHINTHAYCLLLFHSVFVVGIVVIVLLTFILLPVSSQELITYIFELVQLIVVLISTQFAYKLFFSSSFSWEKMVGKFREVYAKRGSEGRLVAITRRSSEELDEVAGEFVAELTDVIVHKISPRSPRKNIE